MPMAEHGSQQALNADENEQQPEAAALPPSPEGSPFAGDNIWPSNDDSLTLDDGPDDENANYEEHYRAQLDPGALELNRRPSALEHNEPQHLFSETSRESALTSKVMLWGGYSGIVSFEGVFTTDFTVHNNPANSSTDVDFLRSLHVPTHVQHGLVEATVFRFLAPGNPAHRDRIPTAMELLHALHCDDTFHSEKQTVEMLQQRSTVIDYPAGQERNRCDEIHTDGKQQYVFSKLQDVHFARGQKRLSRIVGASFDAHQTLREYVTDGRLYYCAVHCNEEYDVQPGNIYLGDTVYLLVVGVSPHSGNLVGVFSARRATDLTDSYFARQRRQGKEQIEQGATTNAEEVDAAVDDQGEEKLDKESLRADPLPDAGADGEPQHVFVESRDESVLSARLMLWGGYSGVVSFEGMLADANTAVNGGEGSPSNKDLEFLHGYEAPPSMSKGAMTSAVYKFLCVIPGTQYKQHMPSGTEVIRELRNEANFKSGSQPMEVLGRTEIPYPPQRHEHDDEVHTDREQQYIFCVEDDLEEEEEEEGKDSFNDVTKLSMEAHRNLEKYVRKEKLYYAVFHTKRHTKYDEPMSDYVYAFAVGVSPYSGNLIGVFSPQVSHNLTS